jgi:hypothetical protein
VDDQLSNVVAGVRDEFPEFSLVYKKDSHFMKVLNVLLKIVTFGLQKYFMSRYTTTVGYTVYIPATWNDWDWRVRATILRHEAVHMRQRKKYGMILFAFLYLLFPLPVVFAYYRKKFEQEAYEESMRANLEYFGPNYFGAVAKEHVVAQFTSARYVWTWPWRSSIEDWYDAHLEAILAARRQAG